MFKKVNILSLLTIVSSYSLLGQVKPPSGTEVGNALKTELGGWVSVINYILLFMIFGGTIYVVGSLLSKREASKGVIVAWGVSIIIWSIAYAIFGSKLF